MSLFRKNAPKNPNGARVSRMKEESEMSRSEKVVPERMGPYRSSHEASNVAYIYYSDGMRQVDHSARVRLSHEEELNAWIVDFYDESLVLSRVLYFEYIVPNQEGSTEMSVSDPAVSGMSLNEQESPEMPETWMKCPSCGSHEHYPTALDVRNLAFDCPVTNDRFLPDEGEWGEIAAMEVRRAISNPSFASTLMSAIEWIPESGFTCPTCHITAGRSRVRQVWSRAHFEVNAAIVMERTQGYRSAPSPEERRNGRWYTLRADSTTPSSRFSVTRLANLAQDRREGRIWTEWTTAAICDACAEEGIYSGANYSSHDAAWVHNTVVIDPYDRGWTTCEDCGEWGDEDQMSYIEDYGTVCDDCRPSSNTPEVNYRCHSCGSSDSVRRNQMTDMFQCAPCAALEVLSTALDDYNPLERFAPYFTFGVECEVGANSGRLGNALRSAGLTEASYPHDYHCRCTDCTRSRWMWQTDPTVEAELPSQVFHSDDSNDLRDFDAFFRIAEDAQVRFDRVESDGSEDIGAHVNIGWNVQFDHLSEEGPEWVDVDPGYGVADVRQLRASGRLLGLVSLYASDLESLAGQYRPLREYNGSLYFSHREQEMLQKYRNVLDVLDRGERPDVSGLGGLITSDPDGGDLLVFSHKAQVWGFSYDTGKLFRNKGNRIEYRMWNGTGASWRSRLSVAVSAAMSAWALSDVSMEMTEALGLVETLGMFLSEQDRALLDLSLEYIASGRQG